MEEGALLILTVTLDSMLIKVLYSSTFNKDVAWIQCYMLLLFSLKISDAEGLKHPGIREDN